MRIVYMRFCVVTVIALIITFATALFLPITINSRVDISPAHFGAPLPFVVQDLSVRHEKMVPPWQLTIQSPWNNPTSVNLFALFFDAAYFSVLILIISYCIGKVVAFYRTHAVESSMPFAAGAKFVSWSSIMTTIDKGLPTVAYPFFIVPTYITLFILGLFIGFRFGFLPVFVSSFLFFWIGHLFFRRFDKDFLVMPFAFEHIRYSIFLYVGGAILLWLYNFTSLEFGGPYNLGVIMIVGIFANALMFFAHRRL